MCAPVILESLGIRQTKFVVTKKDGRTEKGSSLRLYTLPHVLMLGICLLSIAVCVLRIVMSGAFYDAIILYWLVINVKNLFFAVCFMLGRTNFRMAERFDAVLPAEIEFDGRILQANTCDVSETGLAVKLNRPVYIPFDKSFLIRLWDREYKSGFSGELTYVVQQGNEWKYCIRIADIEEADRRDYLQMGFDRDHALPKVMSPSVGLYDDFAANINKRGAPARQSMRKLPRIPVNRPLAGAGEEGTLLDFNYRYVTIRFNSRAAKTPEIKQLALGPGLTARLVRADVGNTKGRDVLYAIENWRELVEEPALDRLLDTWLSK
jgi:cellulose synthase (UDP-forming)